MAKKAAKTKSSNSDDFVFTIDDNANIADLDAAGELNPDFQFEDDDFGPVVDFQTPAPQSQEDELDSILKRRGLTTVETDANAAAGTENFNDQVDQDNDNEETGPEEDSDSEEDDEVEPKDDQSIAKDKSGFFEDGDTSKKIPFTAMNLSRPLLKGVSDANYTTPTPVQSAVIPVALLGKDIVAGAETGSGKTAAYLIPTLERLVYRPTKTAATRVVILTPTRELAMQVYEVGQQLGKFIGGLRFGLAVGGLSLRAQEQQLRSKPDIVVATPGRFIDHVRNSPSFSVDQVEVLVLDEADRMLEEGFEAELTEILKLVPAKRQTLLFSATMNNTVQDLVQLSLKSPVRLMITPPKQAAKGLVQEFVRIRKQHEENRPAALITLLKKLGNKSRVIVFVAQKKTAHRLRVVAGLMGIRLGELHGSLSQEQRINNITQFKNMEVPVLVCTDLASRGLDIPKIEVVINYELPQSYDTYLHRVGRTARAGRSGTAISLVGESTTERQVVKQAVNASNASKQKILGRNVDWEEVKAISKQLEDQKELVNEVLEEEKAAKEIGAAEKEIQRAENLMEHQDEIRSRPRRTWFDKDEQNKQSRSKRKAQAMPQSNTQKKKKRDSEVGWAYKKTKGDRKVASQRGANRAIVKSGAKKVKNATSN